MLAVIRLGDYLAVWTDNHRFASEFEIIFLSYTVTHSEENIVLICKGSYFCQEKVHGLRLQIRGRNQYQLCSLQSAGTHALTDVAIKADDDTNTSKGCIVDLISIFRRCIIILLIEVLCSEDIDHVRVSHDITCLIDEVASIIEFPLFGLHIEIGGTIEGAFLGLISNLFDDITVFLHRKGAFLNADAL